MFIDGFGISSYRSFGSKLQLIGPCNKINFFIGQNNSGKSNILKFLNDHLQNALKATRGSSDAFKLSDLDQHLGENVSRKKLAFGLRRNGALHQKILQNRKIPSENDRTAILIDYLLQFPEMTRGTDIAWFVYEAQQPQAFKLSDDLVIEISKNRSTPKPSSIDGLKVQEWEFLLGKLTKNRHGGTTRDQVPHILNAISPTQLDAPPVTVIQAVREIKSDSSKDNYDYNGLNIV
jgi:hypothetical protein